MDQVLKVNNYCTSYSVVVIEFCCDANFNINKTHILLKNHMKKSESSIIFNEEVKRKELSPARKQELLKMAVNAFRNSSRINIDDAMENKWMRWKYRDQIDAELKRRSKWLEEAEDSSSGFAIGRRIFEKAEIVVGCNMCTLI